MEFRNLTDTDWQQFLCWAGIEGWRISFQEMRLFNNLWRPYFFAMYVDGVLCGFVSAVAYKESGWVGNLLVPEEQRGKGYGSALFDYAIEYLQQAEPKRIWLTASAAGQPIYERRGFKVVDKVERWVAQGTGERAANEQGAVQRLVDLDASCWGESRKPLILALADDGNLLCCENTLGLLQPGREVWQLGPWLSTGPSAKECRQVLLRAIRQTSSGKDLLVDVLVTAELELVLRTAGFRKTGSNQLMVKSDEPVTLDGVLALASLGSIG